MSNTIRFKKLIKRITIIEKSYLPPIRPTGDYSSKEKDDMRAYLLLIHAEIEFYFEEIAKETVKNAVNKWTANSSYRSHILLSMICFCKKELTTKDIHTRIYQAQNYFEQHIKMNNGIKESNILDLLLPIGIDIKEVDTTWLNTISSFGTNRGSIAHTSARVQNPIDPSTIRSTIKLILSEMKLLDEKIKKLK